LLGVDANPNELPLPGLESWRRGADAAFNTFYDVAGDAVQQALRRAYWNTVCFMRSADYLPRGGVPQDLAPSLSCGAGRPAVEGLSIDNRPLMYSYEASNRLLPGPDRDAVQRAGELYDVRVRKDETSYRMRDRSLRTLHALDAPFWPEPFADGVRYYEVNKSGLTQTGGYTYPAQPTFSDADGARWLNPKLPFGGAAVPREGFSFAVQKPPADAPAGTRARVVITWTPPAP
jgi:hypothetical protein